MLTLSMNYIHGQKFLTILNKKNCLIGGNNILTNSDKGKLVYDGYGIAFDGTSLWGFGNDLQSFTKHLRQTLVSA